MELISIAAATPGQVEAFRYQDGGMERNIQDELDARLDHIYVARVVNWPIANESEWGLTGWTPADSLLLYLSSNNLFVTKGLAYMGGRHLEAGGELFSAADPATDTYYVYLKYTFSGDTFEYEYATTKPTDTNLVKHLMLGTADWSTVTKFWTNAVDLRASNTSLGAPATVSGSDAGAIFTVENTGAGDGLLVKNSDAVIGESGTPQQLIIQGDGTKAISIYNSASSVEMVCSAADTLKIQTVADGDAELIVKTLNGMVMASGIVTSGEWQATVIAKAYLAVHDHTAAGEGGDYPWADVTGFGPEPGAVSSGTSGQSGTATTVSRGDHNHDLGVHNHQSVGAGGDYAWADITGFGAGGSATTVSRSDHDHNSVYYTETEQQDWIKKVHYLERYGSGTVVEDKYLSYTVMKIPASSSDWAYFAFKIPDTWVNTTNSEVVFVYNCVASFTDPSNWYVDVKGYKNAEAPSATWNIYSGNPGSMVGGTLFGAIGSSSIIKFDAGDNVVARIRLDGIENDQIMYIYNAYIAYT